MKFQFTSFFFIIYLLQSCAGWENCPCEAESLCEPVTKVYKKELAVFGDATGGHYKKWNWTEITNVILISTANVSDLYCFAHSRKVRVTLLVGVGGFDKLSEKSYRQQVISTWVNDLKKYDLDGLNLDIEGPAATKEVIDGISDLTQETYATIKGMNPNYLVTFDVYYSPYLADCISFLCYNYTAIASGTDYMIAMDYDASLNLIIARSNSPVDLLAQSYNQYINKLGIPAQHLVMAVPWYGYNYVCKQFYNLTGGDVCVILGSKSSQSDFSYISLSYAHNIDGLKWWPDAKTPYFTTKVDNIYHQFQFDNVESLIYKYKLAEQLGLRGFSMFHAGCLDYESSDVTIKKQTQDMWNAITEYTQKLKIKYQYF